MKPRQRLLAALKGEPLDRVPWAPFLAYFWEAQPSEVRERGQLKWLRDIGADPLLRGVGAPYRVEFDGCATESRIDGIVRTDILTTPYGDLQCRYTYSPNGDTWFLTDHPLKNENDMKIFLGYLERARIAADYDWLAGDLENLGDEALALPLVGTFSKTGFQSMIEHWVGTVEMTYALADYPDTVETVLARLADLDLETARIAAQSPAEAFIFWEDSSTTNISPAWFARYTAPVLTQWGLTLHAEGKLLVHHACGHMRGFLDIVRDLPMDAIESLSPPPTGDVEPWEAKEALGPGHTIIGGIEPTVFLNGTLSELEEYVETLLTRMGAHRYILANSDSCPPGVALEKFRLVTDIVRRRTLS